ncbi:MAG: hypothetical protein GX969_02600 [Firmicutes bacterium]|mgnify:CR=1 FL=1|nr:hypothetical protein [Bacillota bacterium]
MCHPIKAETEVLSPNTGSCTLVLRILRADNGTWQGSIGHVQTGRMKTFQSCLEMLRVLEQIIGTKSLGEKGIRQNADILPKIHEG